MGLENRAEGQYLTILGGKFCQRVQPTVEGAVQRTNKLGNVVWEKFYDSFTGKLVSIKVQDSNYGKTWNFGFEDKGEIYTIQLSYSNSFATAFLKQLPNADLSQPMKLSPSTKEVEGKMKSSLFVNQNGTALKHAYTREVPNGLPDMEQVMVKGALIWDDTKRLDFLYNMVQTTIIPKLGGMKPVAPSQAPVDFVIESVPGDEASTQEAVEDLPW